MAIAMFISKKKMIIIIGSAVLYTLVGFFLCPMLAKSILTDKLTRAFNRQVSIEKISVNPYTLSTSIYSLVIKGKNKNVFISADKLHGNLSIFSLFTFSPVVSDVYIEAPYVNIVRNSDNSFNFSDLFTSNKKDPASLSDKGTTISDNQKKIINFVLKKARISQGKIQFLDKVAKTSHVLENLTISLSFLSSRREKRYEKTKLDIGFVVNDTPVDVHIESTPFTQEFSTFATIKTKSIDVLHYLSYLPLPKTLFINDIDLNLDLKAVYQKKNKNDLLSIQGKVHVLNGDIKNAQKEDILIFSELNVDLASSDILAGQFNISKMNLLGANINLSRDKQGELSLLKHIPNNGPTGVSQGQKDLLPAQKRNLKTSPQTPFTLMITDFEIKDAKVYYKDFINPTEFGIQLIPLNLSLINIVAQQSISGEYILDVETDQKEKLVSKGTFGLSPLKLNGDLHLSNAIVDRYSPYFETFVPFIIEKGRSSLICDFSMSENEDQFKFVVKNNELLIEDFVVRDKALKEEWVNIPQILVKDSIFDLGNKKIDTGTIFSSKGKILLKRFQDGQINFIRDTKSPKESTNILDPSLSSKKTFSWDVTLNKLAVKNYNVQFNDLSCEDPVKIDLSDILIDIDNLKTIGKQKANIVSSMIWNKTGQIQINGGANPSGLSGDFDMVLKKIDIKSLQPYFTDAIKILVTKGDFNTKGQLALRFSQEQNQIRFKGDTSVTNFICLDKKSANDFFKCDSLYFSGLSASTFPLTIDAKDISLTDFYSRIIVSDKGQMNISSIFKDEESAPKQKVSNLKQGPTKKTGKIKKPSKIKKTDSQVNISNVTLQGGSINFSDYLTQPNFAANMKQITGSITGLSSDPQKKAKLHLQGLHGQSSPLEIVGVINPLAQKKYLDMKISYKDIELVDFTPYSSKYLGYKIAKGKLILDLEYLIDGNTLKSENRVIFDKFTLGEAVESKDATSLPVSLAITLLTDGDGRINLNLPVTGQLDDPKFSVATIIMKMVGNLILKVATSPFSIIGAMFGGGEDLGYIDFKSGEDKLADLDYVKLDTLIKILGKKPSIKLEIQGAYHADKDVTALREKGFLDLLKAQKLQKMMKSGAASGSLEQMTLTSKEVTQYIHLVYAKAKFPKPRDNKGMQKKIGVEEKSKLLRTHIKVTKDNLRLLAMNRSKRIKEYILSTGKIKKERIFLIEPKESGSSNKQYSSRVDFLLK